MNGQEKVLSRDVEAIRIPSGETVTLNGGMAVFITQSLGGSYTIATDYGLFRLQANDADALGFEKPAAAEGAAGEGGDGGETDAGAVWEQLKTCYDPEIPVNIVDLGLVYDCRVEAGKVEVKMTLTAPGCGMGPVICAEARTKILAIPGVTDAVVDLVWDPPWNQGMISEAGRMQLGLV
jgi:probable FeS assembly SUF system protein SufT